MGRGAVQERVSYLSSSRQYTKVIKPDAVFSIAYRDEVVGGFVEVDRTTISGTTKLSGRLFRRYEAYWHYWRQKLYRERFGFTSVRVFTVTISEARKENFRAMAGRAGEQKRGSNLFWFTPMASYADDPLALQRAVWQTPRDDEYRALIPC